ncbi:hypothetical protein [Oryzomonas rubra]|uniref:Uncharacterized protein n=1 Tax=Oryzomonas rubra TaxID=2509454 RepID=A0A5A9X5K2_9BACT|nr:hypothetical protein [Oryzomonas rubra]KAA0888064.1 hypothetical protein ET418_16830 [Oryzomonas rubra]
MKYNDELKRSCGHFEKVVFTAFDETSFTETLARHAALPCHSCYLAEKRTDKTIRVAMSVSKKMDDGQRLIILSIAGSISAETALILEQLGFGVQKSENGKPATPLKRLRLFFDRDKACELFKHLRDTLPKEYKFINNLEKTWISDIAEKYNVPLKYLRIAAKRLSIPEQLEGRYIGIMCAIAELYADTEFISSSISGVAKQRRGKIIELCELNPLEKWYFSRCTNIPIGQKIPTYKQLYGEASGLFRGLELNAFRGIARRMRSKIGYARRKAAKTGRKTDTVNKHTI